MFHDQSGFPFGMQYPVMLIYLVHTVMQIWWKQDNDNDDK